MPSSSIIGGVIAALIAAVVFGTWFDDPAAGIMWGVAIGIVVAIALNAKSWGSLGRRDR